MTSTAWKLYLGGCHVFGFSLGFSIGLAYDATAFTARRLNPCH